MLVYHQRYAPLSPFPSQPDFLPTHSISSPIDCDHSLANLLPPHSVINHSPAQFNSIQAPFFGLFAYLMIRMKVWQKPFWCRPLYGTQAGPNHPPGVPVPTEDHPQDSGGVKGTGMCVPTRPWRAGKPLLPTAASLCHLLGSRPAGTSRPAMQKTPLHCTRAGMTPG